MNTVLLLAPDKGSGEAFDKKIKQRGISTILRFYNISPRVLGDEINTSNQVTIDLENALKDALTAQLPVAIACNTLQLWLPKVNQQVLAQGKVLTTFEACEDKFETSEKRPVWLGTTPISKLITKFPTLYSLKLFSLQSMVQEIIWRIKMQNHDDISTAPDSIKLDDNNIFVQKSKLSRLKNEIYTQLKMQKINSVILGCTELPIIFGDPTYSGIRFYDAAEILADYINNQ